MLNKLENSPLFVLDVANNHFGDMDHAKRIIEEFSAIATDLDVKVAIKFQYRDLDTFIHPDFRNRRDIKYVDRFLSTELRSHQLLELADLVRKKQMILMTTPFDENSVDLAIEAKVDIIKVASACCDDLPLLSAITKMGRPIIASTAGAKINEIDRLVSILESSNQDFALMHCVAIYPTPNDLLNLRQINLLQDRYPNVPVGWSTHEDPNDFEIVRLAAACGARIFERHIGIGTSKYPQNEYSSTPDQVRTWINAYKSAATVLGAYERLPATELETKTLRSLKRAIFAKNSLVKGQAVTRSDIFYAIPASDTQILANSEVDSSIMKLGKDASAPICSDDLEVVAPNREYEIKNILFQIRGLLSESRTALNSDAVFELSHHYGFERFREFGATLITCINREYAKKILVQLPRQKHPYHFHKVKEETFQLLWGDVEMTVNGKKTKMHPGDTCLVKPGEWHKFQTLNGAVIEEISTTYTVSDSCYEDPKISIQDPKIRKTKIENWQPAFGFIRKLI